NCRPGKGLYHCFFNPVKLLRLPPLSIQDLSSQNRPAEAEGVRMEKLAQQNIQEAFLNNARKDKTFLTIYLMSGVKLSGRIKSFDKYSVILEASNQEQLIFKHAISTVLVSRPYHSGPKSNAASVGSHRAPSAPLPK